MTTDGHLAGARSIELGINIFADGWLSYSPGTNYCLVRGRGWTVFVARATSFFWVLEIMWARSTDTLGGELGSRNNSLFVTFNGRLFWEGGVFEIPLAAGYANQEFGGRIL